MATNRSKTEPLIIVILGCTGTGKSKLSIEIGRRIGGEIISADSMQVYKGLDIITNKVTLEERAIIPHHLLDFVEANEKFSVVEFKTVALDVISDILSRQKVPIIVGGTNYYIESLLWENLIDEGRAGEIRSKFWKVENEERKEAGPARESNTQNTFAEESENVNLRSLILEKKKRNKDNETRDVNTESASAECEIFQGDEGNNSRKPNVKNEERDDDDSAREKGSQNTIVECERNSAKPRPERGELVDFKCSVKEDYPHTDSLGTYANPSPVLKAMATGRHEDTSVQNSLHEQLSKVDFAMAQKLHPNDTRKIKRSLQVYERSGITHTEHLAHQQSREGSSKYSGPMRFNNVCVLWLQCEFEILDKRLDARVDQMIEQGLVDELTEFHNSWKSECGSSKIKNNEGIFQSIGFKEFREFFENSKADESPELFSKCVEAMKCATRRYARKQVRWVNNRFLGRPSTSSPDVYSLDATDLGQWECNVLEKAVDIVKSFQKGETVTHAPLERVLTNTGAKHSNHTCTVCNGRIIIGDQNWAAHVRSRSHRHYKKKQKTFEDASTT